MSRRLKPDLPKVQYHITTRTAQQVFWMDDKTKKMFDWFLAFFAKVYYVKIIAKNLISNHYHIVLEMYKPDFDLEDIRRRHQLAQSRLKHPRPFNEDMAEYYYRRYTDLSMLMWDFNNATAKAFNKAHGTKGHFWGARFKAEVIEDGLYLMNAIAYVELNAVRAGIVANPVDWPFCTAGQIFRAVQEGKTPYIEPSGFLAHLDAADRPAAYLAWMEDLTKRHHDPEYRNQPAPMSLRQLVGDIDPSATMDHIEERRTCKRGRAVYGSPSFVEKILGKKAVGPRSRDGPKKA